MKVVLNNLTAIRRRTGVGHYVAELLRSLRAEYVNDQFATFPGPWVERGARAWGSSRACLKHIKKMCFLPSDSQGGTNPSSPWLNNVARGWAAWQFKTFWSGRSFDLYHEPNHVPLPCDRPTVATVHDLSAVLYPQWHPPDRAVYYERHFAAGLKRCSHLLADSEFIRRQLIETFNVAPDRVKSVPLGIRSDLRPLPATEVQNAVRRLDLPPSFLLHVGTIEPRKNLLMLMRAYCDLPSATRERCPLVLAGGWGWNTEEITAYYHAEARHRNVQHLGYVADADLPALYIAARALVFPSHYEGFGLPPLEMLACGGAVLCSKAGALVEIVGRQAHTIDALDLAGWRHALRRVIEDDDWLGLLRRDAETVARPYTWRRCARGTFAVYEIVLGKRETQAA